MDQVSIALVQEILESILEFKGLISDIAVNKSLFLKSAFFLAEFRQCLALIRECSAQALHAILLDIKALGAIASWYSGRRSRVYLLCKSQRLVREIQDTLRRFALHLHHVEEHLTSITSTSAKEQVSELKVKLQNTTFTADSGNEELASAITAVLGSGIYEEAGLQLLEQITRCLGASMASLIQELVEDIQLLDQSQEPETCEELNSLLVLCNSLAAFESKQQSFRTSFTTEEAIPPSFLCPITGQLMREPVIADGGASYEKSALIEWLSRGNSRCPITNVELNISELVPNKSLENAIHQFVERSSIDKLTRAIKQIKLGDSPEAIQVAVDTILELIETPNSAFKRHVVALDGVEPLVELLQTSQDQSRREKLVQILGSIAAAGDDCKASVAKAGAVPLLLKALNKSHGDDPAAVRILLMLSGVSEGKEAILSAKGSIITIASAVTLDSPEQRSRATKLLNNLCERNPWVAIEAASSGVFEPLVRNLHTGDERGKLEMARAISVKLELNEISIAALVSAGAVKPLLDMLCSESVDNRIAAAQSLTKLSAVERSRAEVVEAGSVHVFMDHLSKEEEYLLEHNLLVTLTNLSTEQECVKILSREQNISRFLELLKHQDPGIQLQVIRILHQLAKVDDTARLWIKGNSEAVEFIVEQLRSTFREFQSNALGLLSQLSSDRASRDGVVLSSEIVSLLVKLLEEPTISNDDKESILRILSGTAKNRKEVRETLINPGSSSLRIILRCIQTGTPGMKENAVSLLTRLTDPSNTEERVYDELGRLGVMSLLRETLETATSDRAREHSAANLGHLSRKTSSLTEKQTLMNRLLALLGLRQHKRCQVHSGKCNPKTSFCLAESKAVPLLIKELSSSNMRNAERGLDALLTLLQDESTTRTGVDFLVKHNVIAPVVGLVGKSPRATEKAVMLLERIFKRRRYREQKYSRIARSSLSTTMTSGTIEARRSAAKALMHLGLMTKGSTYSTTDVSLNVDSNRSRNR